MFASSTIRSTSRVIKNVENAERFYRRTLLRESPLSSREMMNESISTTAAEVRKVIYEPTD